MNQTKKPKLLLQTAGTLGRIGSEVETRRKSDNALKRTKETDSEEVSVQFRSEELERLNKNHELLCAQPKTTAAAFNA